MTSLYRKWRSRSFEDLVGQDHVVQTLRHAVADHRVAHAYLFTGPRGTGKTSTARILAKAVNCLTPDNGNPCNHCANCVAANEGRAMDVLEIDAASNTSVDNVRDLRDRVGYAAGEGTYKVYIVDEVHRLSGAAFDAFLKTLEEPPPHVVFVFASTEPQKVPETIMSRCQRFDFKRISPRDTLARLRYVAGQEEISISDDALMLLTQFSGGSLRDGLGLLDQVVAYHSGEVGDVDVRDALGLADPTVVARIADALIVNDLASGLNQFHAFVDAGGDPGQLSRQFIDYWRALLLFILGTTRSTLDVDPAWVTHLEEHGKRIRPDQADAVLRAFTRQEVSGKFAIPDELPFEMAYVGAALSLAAAREPSKVPAARVMPGPVEADRVPDVKRTVHETERQEVAPPPAAVSAEPDPAHDEGPIASPVPSFDGDSSDLDESWQAIVAHMGSKSKSLQAVLRSAYLLKAENGEMTVGFVYDFHANQFAEQKKRKLLEQVVEEALRVSYRVNCVRTTKDEVKKLRGDNAVFEDDGFVAEAAERLRAFHARELGNGHS